MKIKTSNLFQTRCRFKTCNATIISFKMTFSTRFLYKTTWTFHGVCFHLQFQRFSDKTILFIKQGPYLLQIVLVFIPLTFLENKKTWVRLIYRSDWLELSENSWGRMSLLLFVFNNPPSKPGFLSNSNKALLQTQPRTEQDLSSYQLGVFSAAMILRTMGGTKICYWTTRKFSEVTMVKPHWQN